MKEPKTPSKLSRAQLTQALDSVPVSHILGKSVSRELTPKQRTFALEVAKGSSGADAYRKAYKTRTKSLSQSNEASRLKARPDVAAEVAAYKAAIDAETYRTPAGLRSLIIQSLVQTIIDPDTPPAVRVQAAKVAGQITEVGLYTARSEQRIIRSSDDARAELMAQIRELANAEAVDVTAIDRDADALMAELAAGDADSGEDETHRTPTPLEPEAESLAHIHTIPHEQSPSFSDPSDPTPSSQDDPPSPS